MSQHQLLYDKFENRYLLKGMLCNLTSLHIGDSTNNFLPASIDNTVIKDIFKQPFIPGSSLKGVWRAYSESILRAGVLNCNACTPDDPCISHEEVKKIRDSEENIQDKLFAKEIFEKSCPICRLFGSQVLAGKLLIRDLPVIADTWAGHYEIRSGVAIDRDSGTAIQGAVYDIEAVPPGVCFDFQAVAENLNDEELKVLLLGVMELQQGNLHLGGLTSRGLGRVKLVELSIEKVTPLNLIKYLNSGRGEELDIKAMSDPLFTTTG